MSVSNQTLVMPNVAQRRTNYKMDWNWGVRPLAPQTTTLKCTRTGDQVTVNWTTLLWPSGTNPASTITTSAPIDSTYIPNDNIYGGGSNAAFNPTTGAISSQGDTLVVLFGKNSATPGYITMATNTGGTFSTTSAFNIRAGSLCFIMD